MLSLKRQAEGWEASQKGCSVQEAERSFSWRGGVDKSEESWKILDFVL